MGSPPFISIVVPTHGRSQQLAECLEALVAQDHPRDRTEIIVVDDGGPDPLDPVVERWRGSADIRLHRQQNAGPASARNTGARLARGDFLAFTDDDCRPEPDWLSTLAVELTQEPRAMVGGRTVNTLTGNSCAIASQSLVTFLYGWYNRDPRAATFFTSNNVALSVELFRELGGFDTSFRLAAGEDRELCDHWHFRGWPMIYTPAARVRHAHPLRLRSYLRQHFNYGRGAFGFHRRRGDRGKKTRVEPPSFYLCLLKQPWSESLGWRTLPVTGLLALSQVANAAGYFRERFSRRSDVAPEPTSR